ncbi:FlgD immunoglobulin-like domain containing protein [Candidatus Eisenbacteria bacterium]|uniref:FlgD immunoglobulin-like domain containing protein n=1 Tax=Eiseniibacteriota bacterium TaxID=2212470 RepID=A0ABV6YKM1_UNCEI
MKNPSRALPVLVLTLLLHLPASADVILSEGVLGSGGSGASGPDYSIQSTLGQACPGKTSGEEFSTEVGFWDQREHIALSGWNDNNAGSCVLTLTDQGSIGFVREPDGPGTGFVYPVGGENHLFIGGLWVGESQTYVANHDYTLDPSKEWVVATEPDGHVWIDTTSVIQQDIHAAFTDSAATSPRGLRVDLESWAFAVNSVTTEMVILKYTIQNVSGVALNDLYAGVFLDYDLDVSTQNTGGTIDEWNLIYMTGATSPHVGLQLLQDERGTTPPRSNLSFIYNPDFVWPQNHYVLEADKYDFLSAADAEHILTDASEPDDYSVMVSAGPFDLAPGEEYVVGFTMLGGEDLENLKVHATAAQLIWEKGWVDVPSPGDKGPFATRLFPVAPNPFTQGTLVRFNVSRAGQVDVGVYDPNGRLVRTLARGEHPAMRYAMTWDGRDQNGHRVSAGVYFVRLRTEEERFSRRVICIR